VSEKYNFTVKENDFLFRLIGKVSKDLNAPAYVVGGFVRNYFLNIHSKDIDIVCVGNGIQLAEKVASLLHPIPKVVTYSRYGTARFRFNDIEFEFVGARKESYHFDSRKPAVEEGTLEDDQKRRDFTMNALAFSLHPDEFGLFLDSFNGLEDLRNKIIKTPLDPGITFSDDPLRMMRAIRFAAQLGFVLDGNTKQAIKRYNERIAIISQERIAAELNKIILSSKPSIGFLLLFETGLLHLIFPEMVLLHGVENKNGKGHKDNFYHTLQVLDNLSQVTDNLWLRWAALLHDIAKPQTKRWQPDIGWTFHGHEVQGANMAYAIFKRFKLPMDFKLKYVQQLVRLHLRPISLTKENITDAAIRRLIVDAGEHLDDLMLLCKADITSKNQTKVEKYIENYDLVMERIEALTSKDNLRNWQPPITGEIIMTTFSIGPSKEVGLIKSAVREAILDGFIPNDYDAAYNFMLKKGRELGVA
jgi:putative nucleotidyltransferase with HDIG domain